MATVSTMLKDTFSNAKHQIEGFEKKAAKQVALLEKKAKKSVNDVKKQVNGVRKQVDDVPHQLKGAWEGVVDRLRGALDFASNEDLKELSTKVDELAKKVEKLLRGEKIKAAAGSKGNKSAS